jgi:EAL domain-containing protein (putative c-di-GMP-specific phosphodiesterase class I)
MHVAAETLVALHGQGVGLAIDDFGTGYSSLSYLRRVPVDRIKIDRSFINDVTTSEDAAVIAATIVKLAHSLRLGVVAEGVETAAQAAFVRRTGCEYGQGYYYAEPVTAAELPALLTQPAQLGRKVRQA